MTDAPSHWLLVFVLTFPIMLHAQAPPGCKTVHGRANLYSGDGQRRIWAIGTHHEYTPDESSIERFDGWLEAGVTKKEREKGFASPESMLYLFADFEICPTEPFKQGSVQRARMLRADHRHYVPVQ